MNVASQLLDKYHSDANGNTATNVASDAGPEVYLDRKTGEEIQLLSNRHAMPLAAGKQRLHLGRALVGCITGRWDADSELEKLAMGGVSNISGAILVNDELAAGVIDYARSKSVVISAGVRTIPMHTDRLLLARATSDPTLEYKAENSAFTGTQVN